jgi:hypothetical protein
MTEVILNNVLVCTVPETRSNTYVPNSGRLASVSDRVDLRNDAKGLQSGPEGITFDSTGINRLNGAVIFGR